MPQKSARLQYILLALVTVFALTHFYMGADVAFNEMAHGDSRARYPFFLGSLGHVVRLTTPEAVEAGRRPSDTALTVTLAMPEAKKAGLQVGDAILSINHRPFTGTGILLDELRHSSPGQPMALTILRPDQSERPPSTSPLRLSKPLRRPSGHGSSRSAFSWFH